jgi:hypothetical protein
MFMKEPKEVSKLHYETSLRYAEEISDQRMDAGILDASEHLGRIIDKHRAKKNRVPELNDTVEDVKARLLNEFATSKSDTKH